MSDTRQIIPIAGLFLTFAVAVHMVARLDGQQAPPAGDFTAAATAEVRDAQGQIVLRGQFAQSSEEDGEIERKAALTSTGVDADAAGDAEIEFARTAPGTQEIEFSARNLTAGATFTLVIDGQDIVTATADRRGRAEAEIDVNASGPAPAR